MNSMKLRFLAMGCIITILGVAFLILRGESLPLIGIIVVGIVLLIIGIVWNPKVKSDTNRKDMA